MKNPTTPNTTYTHEIPTSSCEYLANGLEATRHLYKHTNHHDIAIKALRKAALNADGETATVEVKNPRTHNFLIQSIESAQAAF